MATRIDINDFRCYNQLTNGADFSLNTSDYATTLVGNVGELVQLKYKATFNYGSNASVGNAWTVKAGKITRANGNFQTDDGLVEGDVFLFFSDWANYDTAAVEFTGTVTGFSDAGKTVLFSVSGTQVTTGSQTNVGFICNPITTANRHTALFLNFGAVANDDNYSNASLVTGSPQGYLVTGMAGITAAISGTWMGSNLDAETGSFTAYIISESAGDRTATYQITHEFIIVPSYIAGQLSNLENNIAPSLFAGGASLKYTFAFELRKAKTSTATAKVLVYDSLIGAVGWFNENFNGGVPVYTLFSCTFIDTATSASRGALQPYRKTTATITVDGGTTAGQRVGLYVQWLPASIASYTDTLTNYLTNFLADSAIVEEGTGDLIGAGIIKRVQANDSGALMIISADFEYNITQGAQVVDGYYLITVSIQDPAIAAANSDRVMVVANVSQYEALGTISGLIDFTKFDMLVHDQTLGVDNGNIVVSAWNEDGLLLDFAFDLDLDLDAVLSQLVFKLVAYDTVEETYFELDSYTLNCTGFVVSGGVQQLEVDTTRGYLLATGDQFNFVKLTTGALVGNLQGYTGSFGQKVSWQDWQANQSADTVFFDSAEPNNNLNFKSSNYSGLNNYEIKIICEATLTGVDDLGVAGTGFEVAQVDAITVYDYAVSDDGGFTAGDILTLDPTTSADLDGALYFDRDTLFRTVWTTANNSLANIWAVHRLDVTDANGYTSIQELSSIYLPPVQALIPITGQTLLYVYASGADIVTEGLISGAALSAANSYKLSARIERLATFLYGNAKVYDGSFDCDTIASWSQLNRTSIFSFNIALNSIPINALSSGTFSIFSQGRGTTTQHFTIRFVRTNIATYRINISMQNSGTNRINKDFNIVAFGRDVYNITFDGSSTAAGLRLYKNGVEIIGSVVADNLTLSIISTDTNGLIGAFRGAVANTFFMNGFIRQLEIINRVATPAEIASASATGSFQGAGTVSNAEYLLAVDFDKTGTADLTTRASTPSYTITAVGGAAYTQYLP